MTDNSVEGFSVKKRFREKVFDLNFTQIKTCVRAKFLRLVSHFQAEIISLSLLVLLGLAGEQRRQGLLVD